MTPGAVAEPVEDLRRQYGHRGEVTEPAGLGRAAVVQVAYRLAVEQGERADPHLGAVDERDVAVTSRLLDGRLRQPYEGGRSRVA